MGNTAVGKLASYIYLSSFFSYARQRANFPHTQLPKDSDRTPLTLKEYKRVALKLKPLIYYVGPRSQGRMLVIWQ
jgi:hypothetical protein